MMRSVTIILSESCSCKSAVRQAFFWRDKVNFRFTLLIEKGVNNSGGVGRWGADLTTAENEFLSELVETGVRRVFTYRPDELLNRIRAHSLYSDLIVIDWDMLRHYEIDKRLAEFGQYASGTPVFIPGPAPPCQKLLAFAQPAAVKYAVKYKDYFLKADNQAGTQESEIVLFSPQNGSSEHIKRILSYAQIYCSRVGLAPLDDPSEQTIELFMTQGALLAAKFEADPAYGNLLALMLEKVASNEMSLLLV